MKAGRRGLLVGGAAAIALAGGLAARRLLSPAEPAAGSEPMTVYELVLPDLDGRPQNLSQWKGKILIANFWATWCEPCREEIPALVRIQSRYAAKGVQLVGISIDTVDNIRQFTPSLNINYPLVVGGLESLNLLRRMGNQAGVLPFTLILKPDGSLAKSHAGPLTEEDLDKLLKNLII